MCLHICYISDKFVSFLVTITTLNQLELFLVLLKIFKG